MKLTITNKLIKKQILNLRRIISFSLAVYLFVVNTFITVCAVPAMDAEVTEENILSLLEEYDPDGAFIIKESLEAGEDILFWWYGSEKITDNIKTAVHEECHSYTSHEHRADSETIYIGEGKEITVEFTDVFNSSEMAEYIPEELRTFRYDTYVGNPEPNLASDVEGVYGLLDEFTSYYYGCNNTVRLYNYYCEYANSPDDWINFLNDYMNGVNAFLEFDFFILRYLMYAKDEHQIKYKRIMNNNSFIDAYCIIREKYIEAINKKDELYNGVQNELIRMGHDAEWTDKGLKVALSERAYQYIGSLEIEEALLNELAKEEYLDMLSEVYNRFDSTAEFSEVDIASSAVSETKNNKIDPTEGEDGESGKNVYDKYMSDYNNTKNLLKKYIPTIIAVVIAVIITRMVSSAYSSYKKRERRRRNRRLRLENEYYSDYKNDYYND